MAVVRVVVNFDMCDAPTPLLSLSLPLSLSFVDPLAQGVQKLFFERVARKISSPTAIADLLLVQI